MSNPTSSLSFAVDSGGGVELIRGDQPHNIDFGATQPIEIPMADYFAASTSNN